jgi:PhnB protein
MKTINPWINFNGNAEEAFDFYQSVFGGEFTKVVRFKDIASEEFPVAEIDAEKIMRITLAISEAQTLTGNDVPEFMGTVNESENRSKIYISVESREEAEKIFTELSSDGYVEVPIDESTEEVFTMFRDKYGIEWIVEFDPTA